MALNLHMKSPCSNCPFRKDTLKGWLGADRMDEIIESDSFVCHKSANKSLEDRRQCAGHMNLMEERNEYYRLAKALNIELNLSGKELIFETEEDCIKHHTHQRHGYQ